MPVDLIITRWAQSGDTRLLATLTQMERGFGRVELASTRAGRIGSTLAAGGALGILALGRLASASLNAAGQVQRVEIGFQTVLKDAQKVKALSEGVRDFDIKTPFSYLETAKGAQMLLAAGFREDLLPTLNAVGNAVVAAGGGTEKFTRALAIMGKIKTAGVLTGVRVNQFASAGINIKDILKKQLGLTDDQMVNIGRLKLKADVVIPALIKGLNEQFAGGIERASKSYLGSIETLKGSQDKLLAGIGKSIEGSATTGVRALIGLTDAASKFVSLHPRMTAMAFTIGGMGALALVIYGLARAKRFASLATLALEMATKKDIVAERVKTGVAYAEAGAHNAAAMAAGRHAAANGMLALPGPAGVGAARGLGAGAAAGGLRGLLARPLLSDAAMMKVWTSKMPVAPWLEKGLAGATVGRAVVGAGLGLAAGAGVNSDLSALGDPNAGIKGIATGIGAAALAAFNPPAALLIGAATALRYGVDYFVNQPQEKAAQGDISDAEAKSVSKMGRRERAAFYAKKAAEAQERGDEAVAQSYTLESLNQRKFGIREEKKRKQDQWLSEQQAWGAAQDAKRPVSAADRAYQNSLSNVSGGVNWAKEQRDGTRMVTIALPEGRGDRLQRKLAYNNRTAAPNFAY